MWIKLEFVKIPFILSVGAIVFTPITADYYLLLTGFNYSYLFMLSLIENINCLLQFYFNQVDKPIINDNKNKNNEFFFKKSFTIYMISLVLLFYFILKLSKNKSFCHKFSYLFFVNMITIFLFKKGTTPMSLLSLGLLTPFLSFNLTASMSMIILSYYKEKPIYNL